MKFELDSTLTTANSGSADTARQRLSTEAGGAAASIREATKRDHFIDTGTDEKKIFSVLNGLTETDLDALKGIYKDRYKIELTDELRREMSGSELDRALNLLNRKDGKTDNAGFFHENLVENKEVFGRSRPSIAKAMRDKLSSMTSAEIEEADLAYKSRYGTDLKSALRNSRFDRSTVETFDTYFKGKDKRTAADTMKLADIALKASNINMFQEAMRDSTAEERRLFMLNGGDARVKESFQGHWYNLALYTIPLAPKGRVRNIDLRHAQDFAREGQFRTTTLIKDSTSKVGDNEAAIETALSQMSDAERSKYFIGRRLSTHPHEADDPRSRPLSEKEKTESITFYKDLHRSLDRAANKTEMLMWEDQIEYKGGSIITRLGKHNGVIKDSPMDEVLSTIETMTEHEWNRLKADPEYRADAHAVLSTFLNRSELARADRLLEQKVGAKDFDESKASAKRSVIDVIKDNTHRGFLWLDNREDDIYKAIEQMSAHEMELYRTDSTFRTSLNDTVRRSLDPGAERDVASALLQKVLDGKQPKQTILEKLAIHSTSIFGDTSKVLREVEKAFNDDPSLFARQKNPITDEDKQFSDKLRKSLYAALGPASFLQYGETLLRDGTLSLQQHIQMNRSIFGIDEKGVMETLAVLPESQRKLLLANDTKAGARDYKYLFKYLNEDEQRLAQVIAEQGETRAEDKLRAYVLGVGGDDADMIKLIQPMTQEDKVKLTGLYSEKYDKNATVDLLDQLKKKERNKAELLIEHVPKTLGDQINQGVALYSRARDGFGSRLVDRVWDGTGFQTDQGLNQLLTTLAPRVGTSPSETRRQEVRANLLTDLSNHRDSREKVAEVATDGAMAILAVGGAYFTGGASLALLAKAGIAGTVGATIKLGGKALVMGSEYDWSKRQVFNDGGRGFVSGALAYMGSTWIAKGFGVGDVPGAHAGQAAMDQIALLAKDSGQVLLQDGAEEAITRSFQSIIRHAIMTHSMKVPEESVKTLAAHVAVKGSEDVVNTALNTALTHALAQQATHVVTNLGIEYGVTAGSGSIGGGSSGFLGGVSDWDPRKTVEENLTNVATSMGTGMAIGATSAIIHKTAYKAIGFGYEKFENWFDPDHEFGDGISKISKFRVRPLLPRLTPRRVDILEHPQGRVPTFRSLIADPTEGVPNVRSRPTNTSSVGSHRTVVADSTD